ncbi:PadR family transcriptional regulator [Pinibacter soli]|uniref:PadR family transcriptional regulator n=1 Tax=Pinibacter soli TaxID=3044211 RepID=A0ABT6RCY4_9BACT|nr:PadR family transcriptional regulator [Pinibacter soli]MDI3320256.1 PadR family transcriptional regulator [Pinibacter soli]
MFVLSKDHKADINGDRTLTLSTKPYPDSPFLSVQNRKIMNIENTQSQMRKGILEFCILSIIRRGEAYPSDIVDEMRAAGLQILEGTLYPLLTRLKNAEMLTYRWVESNSGPPRKYFSLTEKGMTFYKELETTWNELANGVNKLTNKNESLPTVPDNTNTN